jgi:hypothetical protein
VLGAVHAAARDVTHAAALAAQLVLEHGRKVAQVRVTVRARLVDRVAEQDDVGAPERREAELRRDRRAAERRRERADPRADRGAEHEHEREAEPCARRVLHNDLRS